MSVFFQRKLSADVKLRIAFINPPHAEWCLTQTMTWMYVKEHYAEYGRYADHVEWLEPPYKYDQYQSVQDIWQEIKSADVFMFSSYVWNYAILDELAQLVRRNKPEAILILGGPHVGMGDASSDEERPAYDFVAKPTTPGEVFMEDFINCYFENTLTPENISFELRSCKKSTWKFQEYSIYERNQDYLNRLAQYAKERDIEPFIVLETTRGCPYKCSYCEWGGGIGNKIIKKSMDVIAADMRAIAKAGFRDVYSADANFGVFLERDTQILKMALDSGLILTDLSLAKTKKLSVKKKIIDTLYSTGHHGGLNISIQSMSDEAMRVSQRLDLCFQDKLALGKYIAQKSLELENRMPTIEIILAMPGSTLEDFYNEYILYYDFNSWEFSRHVYMVLPDSEVAKPEYCAQHGIELVRVYTDNIDEDGIGNSGGLYGGRKSYFKTIASCLTYDREAMEQMHFMNIAGPILFKQLYKFFSYADIVAFMKSCWSVFNAIEAFTAIRQDLRNIFDPHTEPCNIYNLCGERAQTVISDFLNTHEEVFYQLLTNELTHGHTGPN